MGKRTKSKNPPAAVHAQFGTDTSVVPSKRRQVDLNIEIMRTTFQTIPPVPLRRNTPFNLYIRRLGHAYKYETLAGGQPSIHARMYVIADMYDIQNLKMLALEKLWVSLRMDMAVGSSSVDSLMKLLSYTYEHTPEPQSPGKFEPMRRLVLNYVACHLEVMNDNPKFFDLLKTSAALSGDWWNLARTSLMGF